MATIKWGSGSVSRYRLLPLWQQKYYDQQKYWGPLSRRTNRKGVGEGGGVDLPRPFLKMKKMPWFCKESSWLCLSLGSKSATDLNVLFLSLPKNWYLKPKTELTKCVFSFNKYWIFNFVLSERTDFREYRFFLSLLSLKKH